MSVCSENVGPIRPADVFPQRFLPGQANDWGRTVEERVVSLEKHALQTYQNNINSARADAGQQESVATLYKINGELLVIGPTGTVRLADGVVTANALQADAIDGMTITGALISGGRFQLQSLQDLVLEYSNDCSSASGWVDGSGSALSLDTTQFVSPPSSIRSTTRVARISFSPISFAGDEAMVEFYIRTSGGVQSLTVGIKPNSFDGTENFSYYKYALPVPANTWTKISMPVYTSGEISGVHIEADGLSGTMYVDDLEIYSGSWSEDRLEISRDGNGNAFLTSQSGTGHKTVLSQGRLSLDYQDPVSPFGVNTSLTSEGITVNSTSTSHFTIKTNRGRGDTIALESDNIFLRGAVNTFPTKTVLDSLSGYPNGSSAYVENEDAHYILSGGVWHKVAKTISGRVLTSGDANVTRSVAVTFPAGLFSSAPMISLSVRTVNPQNVSGVSYSGVSTSGVTLYMRFTTATNFWVDWTATL